METTGYDGNARRTLATNRLGWVTQFVYDKAGRLVQTIHQTPSTPIAGDFNNDGVVNNADLTVWKSGFAGGTMTGADYLLWQRNFGATSATASVAAVPEPASACIAVMALFAVSRCRRRASL